jgi:flavin-binding protein dodecin
MSEHVYKTTEIVGTSTTDVDDAIRKAVTKASQSLRNLDWFEVVGIRGHIADGGVDHVQVTMKVGFRLE